MAGTTSGTCREFLKPGKEIFAVVTLCVLLDAFALL